MEKHTTSQRLGKPAYDHARYTRFVNECKEVLAGARGWVSILEAHRESGVAREQLEVVAKALSLKIDRQGGRNGTCVVRS